MPKTLLNLHPTSLVVNSNLVFIVLDCVRPDYLGAYGNDEVYTPTIDKIGDDGAVFENHYTTSPWTNPSISALLTGVYPHNLGMYQIRQDFPEGVKTLFQDIHEAGGTVGSFLPSERFFGDASYVGEAGVSRDLHEIVGWIEETDPGPFMLYSHYWNTHLPYMDKFSKEEWYNDRDRIISLLQTGDKKNIQKVKNLYRASIERASEEMVSAVVGALKRKGVYGNTTLVITADHGESFGERLNNKEDLDLFGMHGKHLYEEILNIPLIIKGPNIPAMRLKNLTRSIDILPTLRNLLNLPSQPEDKDIDGVDLTPTIQEGEGEANEEDSILSTTTYIYDPDESIQESVTKSAIIQEGWKLIWNLKDGNKELYNLDRDPEEKNNEADKCPSRVKSLEREIQKEIDWFKKTDSQDDQNEELHERLKYLGYLD